MNPTITMKATIAIENSNSKPNTDLRFTKLLNGIKDTISAKFGKNITQITMVQVIIKIHEKIKKLSQIPT